VRIVLNWQKGIREMAKVVSKAKAMLKGVSAYFKCTYTLEGGRITIDFKRRDERIGLIFISNATRAFCGAHYRGIRYITSVFVLSYLLFLFIKFFNFKTHRISLPVNFSKTSTSSSVNVSKNSREREYITVAHRINRNIFISKK